MPSASVQEASASELSGRCKTSAVVGIHLGIAKTACLLSASVVQVHLELHLMLFLAGLGKTSDTKRIKVHLGA